MYTNPWTEQEIEDLILAYKDSWLNPANFSAKYKSIRTPGAIRVKIGDLIREGKIHKDFVTESPYPIYDTPLSLEGDALVLPDIELPFHHAEFLNRVLELAQRWNIRQCILAGDVLHFDGLSGWEPNWVDKKEGGVTDKTERELVDFAMTLSSKKQEQMFSLIEKIGKKPESDGLSTELKIARDALKNISELFDKCDFVLGNHCGRLLRSLQTTIDPHELLRLLDINNPKWRIAPFYYSFLETEDGKFRIEHPKNSGKFSASRLASKYLCSILMAHSHQLNFTFDPSGTFYAIEMGCMADERRLAYVGQRSNTGPTHMLGSVIVKNGIPWLLHQRIDWKRLMNMC